MSKIAAMVSDHLNIWTAATERKGGAGRGGGKRVGLYGIERLRSLILDLAVRGKLVPQDPSEEAATASLVRARKSLSEKANFVRRLRWKSSRPFHADETASALPPGWTWARVNDTGFYINGLAFKPSDWADTGRPIIRIQNLTNPSTPFNYARGDYPDEVVVRDGDLLVSWSATLAAFQWSGEDAILNQHIFRVIHEPELTERAYLRLMLEHAIAEMAESEHAHGLVMTHINRGPFLDHLVKVPPLAEQRRIVAKVEELMALCDALEGESATALAAHQTLVETLLATLVDSTDAADLAANWTRLEAQFDTLFTTEASIDVLKQTILELAVRGRLVAQAEEDGSATQLTQQLRKAIPTAKLHPSVSQEEIPFELPAGWAWERFDHIIRADKPIAYGVLVPGDDEPNGVPFVRIADLSITAPSHLPEKAINSLVDTQFLRTRLEGGEILMGVVGSIGKLGIAPASWAGANIARAICRIVPAEQMNRDYVIWLLQSRYMQEKFKGDTRTLAQPTLNIKLIRLAPTPIPPVDEQKRIVSKVDTLMTLCDGLKSSIANAGQIQMRLADAIVERAAA
jgi:type I restriction enzyme S subunit